jgi:purine-nucleoside phosphorylase
MYKHHTLNDFITYFGLPQDYKVDGILLYGSWRKNEHKKLLKEIIKEQGYLVEYEHVDESFLREVLVFKINGKRLWFETGFGGAYISEILHLGSMFGSKKNIVLGKCGGLIKNGNNGDIIIANYSYGDESTTRMYNPSSKNNKHFSDKKLSQSLKKRLTSFSNIYEGPVVTCQAMMFESLENIKNWISEGYLGVEMETSTVFAVSKYFNVPAAGVLFIADNLFKKETILHGNYKKATERRNKIRDIIYKVAIEELLEG